ncbi:cytidine deaminase-like protein [Truncatella angustata]|uniref:Cytidine deaminase-like protein n=1 Tax=Truncatella angustata TaxID=152316 RepID=A0A9P8UQ55_9PEZI|nr:cytidine deaminase-like protein [Truncatella angustata]KAH6656199.1 cytidine deaminase-like protein [Truncatella angustata]
MTEEPCHTNSRMPLSTTMWLTILNIALASACGQQYVMSMPVLQGNIGGMAGQQEPIPPSTRAHWMRQANIALGAPCPFAGFGSVIVNHTANAGLGDLVCSGVNGNRETGNPILHGEVAAINNCTTILTDPNGPYKLSPREATEAFTSLSIYTNAESCPMCASAIRWAGFKEYVYGTSIDKLVKSGWHQMNISSQEIFDRSNTLAHSTVLIGHVLANETDPYFRWQFAPGTPCPEGCSRLVDGCHAD